MLSMGHILIPQSDLRYSKQTEMLEKKMTKIQRWDGMAAFGRFDTSQLVISHGGSD